MEISDIACSGFDSDLISKIKKDPDINFRHSSVYPSIEI